MRSHHANGEVASCFLTDTARLPALRRFGLPRMQSFSECRVAALIKHGLEARGCQLQILQAR